MNFAQVKALFDRYVIGNYSRHPIAFVRGEGSFIWDSEGNRYIDLMPGWGTTLLGHCHPQVVEAVQRQAARLIHVDNTFYIPQQGLLAQKLSERSFGGKCFFCNSGAESVEAALKLARIHQRPNGRWRVVSMLESFHGRTAAAVRATGQKSKHVGVPRVSGFRYVPLNDLDALEAACDDRTAAVIIEPIQGEGGVRIPSHRYMRGLRRLCSERGILLIVDEVQTGMGRTGRWFGYQHYGIKPDILVTAKALGSGVAIGAMVARQEVARSLVPGTHASTFGGNPLACAAALATFEVIERENLLENCRALGEHIGQRLRQMARRHRSLVREVRGRGLMWGMELNRPGGPIFEWCLRRRVRLNCTQGNVIRLLPAMNIPREVLDAGLDVLEQALQQAEEGKL